MNNRLNHPLFFIISLLAGILMPFFGFSQEEPKRVTVVVKAVELTPVKEVVQVPATNVPTVISAKKLPSANYDPVARVPSHKRSLRTNQATTRMPIDKSSVNKKRNSKLTSAQETKTVNVVAKAAPIPKQEPKKEHLSPVAEKQQNDQPTTNTVERLSKPDQKSNPQTSFSTEETTEVVSKTPQVGNNSDVTAQEIQEKYSSRVNTVRYIWIGSFLILAGLVLGLLFGRPAFLVSIAGVVFVIIGLLV